MSQKMRFVKVGDVIKINRRKLRITKIDKISDGVRPDCWGYTMEYVTGKGYSWTGIGRQLEVPDIPENDFIECPCCQAGGIRVHKGKIDRHETGLRYIPYRLYHRFEGRKKPVTELMQKNLCPASSKTPDEAMKIYLLKQSQK